MLLGFLAWLLVFFLQAALLGLTMYGLIVISDLESGKSSSVLIVTSYSIGCFRLTLASNCCRLCQPPRQLQHAEQAVEA